MSVQTPPRVLLVDDEPNLLAGLRRQLHGAFAVTTAPGAPEGLTCIRQLPPFDVVVSDYQMPQMNGAAFLAAVRKIAPDSTRMLLTGQADLSGAAAVVNEGGVFRFLVKPVSREAFVAALDAGVEQHRLVVAERELLEQTLRGSVKALTEVLSLASPLVYARVTRLRRLARLVVEAAGEGFTWQIDLAVMLSQIGAVTLPPSVLERLDTGSPLGDEEQAMVARLPAVADELLADIPRIDEVRAAIRWHDAPYSAAVNPTPGVPAGPGLPLAARVLRIVRDYDWLECAGHTTGEALRMMMNRTGMYDVGLLDALTSGLADAAQNLVELPLRKLEPGMVLAEDICTDAGIKLIPRGHEVSPSLLERIRNFSNAHSRIREPVKVFEPRIS